MGMKRCIVLAVLLAAGVPAAAAGPRDDVVDVLAKCTDVADREARIECYDRAAPQLRAAAGLAPAGQVPAPAPLQVQASAPAPLAPSPQPEAPPPQGQSLLGSLDPFGGEAPPAPTPTQMAYQPIGQEILPITIGVTDYDIAPGGPFTVTLANGQVWRERAGHTETPPFKAGARNFVTIEHGLIGGYDLYLVGSGRLYKVMRIK